MPEIALLEVARRFRPRILAEATASRHHVGYQKISLEN
jgi:oligoribonuclease (3'-5' exoribonuclease)